MNYGEIGALGQALNSMAQANDVEAIKHLLNNTDKTLEEIHQKFPFVDIRYLLMLRKSGDI